MVAEKDEISSSNISPNSKNGKNSLPRFNFPSAFSVKLIPSLNEEEDGFNESLESVGDVVLSLKCKRCSFLCGDKSTLIDHAKSTHGNSASSAPESNSISTNNNNKADETNSNSSFQHSTSTNKSRSSASVPVTKTNDNRSSYNNVQSGKLEKASQNQNQQQPHSEEEGEEVFLCAECDIVFPSEELCCNHMSQVHNLKDFSAQFIREEIISKNTVTDDKPKRQIRPPRQYTAEGGAVVPKKFRVTKDTFFSCSKCNVKFESSEVTKFHEQCHVKSKGSGKGFSCPVCISQKTAESNVTEVFPIWGKISMHLWREHKIDCELHTCSVCKQYKNHLMTKVKDHEKLHYPDANYTCATCNKSFKQYKQLKTHEKYHKDTNSKLPPPQDSRWYTPKECPICKRILADSKCLKKHISAVHNKLKPYGCNICGHTTARKAELQLHVRQHTGEKPYKCPYCSFATGDHNSLRNHKMRHSDTKPYVCPYCDYRCIQSSQFKKHILAAHPGQEVVFLCQLCNHASVNEVLFEAHQKDHENDKETNGTESSSYKGSTKNAGGDANASNSIRKNPADSNKPNRYWLDDEEDSIEMVVDTGGITIPAPEERAEKTTQQGTATPSATETSFMETSILNVNLPKSLSAPVPTMTLCLIKSGLPLQIFDSNDESANQGPSSSQHAVCNQIALQVASTGKNNVVQEKSQEIVTISDSEDSSETEPSKSTLPTMTLSLIKSGPPLEIFDTDESANHYPSDSQGETNPNSLGHIISLFPGAEVPLHKNIIIVHEDEVLNENSIVTTVTSNTNPAAPFLEPLDLSDIIGNDHSNDGTLERLLGIN